MKKLMSIAVVLLLVVCMACPAFATSPTDVGEITTAVDEDGNPVEIEVGPATEIFEIPVEDGGTVDFGDGEVPAEDLTVVYAQDLHSDVLPVTITFNVAGAGANDILHVMHYNGSEWEQVAEGKGTSVTATFDDLSPVAIVLQTVKASAPEDDDEKPTSPQTGANMTMLFAGIAVFLAAGGVALIAKKTHA